MNELEDYNIIADNREFDNAQKLIDAIISQRYRFICFGGGIRGGKSFNEVTGLSMLHKLFPGSRSAIVRDSLETLRRNMLPTCRKAIPKNFIKKYHASNFQWTFTNNSEMFFFAENYAQDKEYKRWNGLEVNFILLEQAEELQADTLEKSFERAGSYIIPNTDIQPQPVVLMTVNPNMGWVKELIYNRWKNGTLPEDWLYIPALITGNPHIPEQYKESLKQLKLTNPIKYQRFVEGDWEIMEEIKGAFWKSFKFDLNVKDNVKVYPDKTLHISFDENVHPYPALSVWQIIDKPGMIVSEYDKSGKLTLKKETGKEIRQVKEFALKHPRNKLRIVAAEFINWAKSINFQDLVFIYGDASSQKEDTKLEKGVNYFTMLKNEISKSFNCRVRKSSKNPPVALSAEFVNAIYGYNFGSLSIVIDSKCKESINDYMFALEDSDGTMLKQSTRDTKTGLTYEKIGHFSDTKRYFIIEAFSPEFRKFTRKQSVSEYTISKSSKTKHY